jgi:HPt (histidine-containing phosphotransfer) domain-containing protein
MDVQMPRLSGYDATIRIRMRPEVKSLPIIAMTANVMASDREKCLACGMTDHIAKPIDLQVLIHAILRHVRTPMESEPAAMDSSKAARDLVTEKSTHGAFAPDAVTAAQRYGIDLQASVARLGVGPAFYQRMARKCISGIPQIVNDIEQALLQGDRERLLDEAHKLKGPCGILGAQVLVSLAVAIEAATNLPGDLLAATMHVNQLRSLTDGLSADATLILGSLAP